MVGRGLGGLGREIVERAHDERGEGPGRVADDEAGQAVLAAWRSLPGDSRALLWRLVLHEERPPRSVPGLGTAPAGVADPGERARDRMRLGLLSELVARAGGSGCASVRRRLGGRLRDSLSQLDCREVDAHLESCEGCRSAAAVLEDVDTAIRERVAPALLPGAFTTRPGTHGVVSAPTAPVLVAAGPVSRADPEGEAEAAATAGDRDAVAGAARSDLLDELAAEVAGDTVPAESLAARVLTVPSRSASLVAASASLGLAAVLLVLGPGPDGTVTADPPAPRGTPATTGAVAAASEPTAGSATGSRSTVGVAVAEPALDSRDALAGAGGGSLNARAGGARAADPRSRVAAGETGRSLAPEAGFAPTPPSPRPAWPAPASPGPLEPVPPASVTPAPGVPGGLPVGPVQTPSGVGEVTTLSFAPAEHGTYLARFDASGGWLVTSVVDERGHRPVEHVTTPSTHLEDRMHAGRLVVRVTRVDAPEQAGAGALTVSFLRRSGSVLPGSGAYALR